MAQFKLSTMCAAIEHTQSSIKILGVRWFWVNATPAYILDHTDRVLGCRYHGWSYDTKGKLTKAPGFEDISTFDKSANGLFEVATHTTRQGLIFVNFDSTSDIVPFNEFYKGLEDELDEFDFGSFEYVESWEQDG